jgi:hypothetical protein
MIEKIFVANVSCWAEKPSGDSGDSIGSPWNYMMVDALEEATTDLDGTDAYDGIEEDSNVAEENAERVVTLTPAAQWWRLRFDGDPNLPNDEDESRFWIRLNAKENIPGVEVLEHGLWEGTPIRRFYSDTAASNFEAVNCVAAPAS